MQGQNTRRAQTPRSRPGFAQAGRPEDRADHMPRRFPAGSAKRIAVARALANNPRLILADEPTGSLDSQSGEEIMACWVNSTGRRARLCWW